MTPKLPAGRQPHALDLPGPDDIDRQTAELLRQAMAAATDEPETEATVDDATITRVMNTLRAEGLFDHPAGQRPALAAAVGRAAAPRAAAAARPSQAWGLQLPAWLWGGVLLLALVAAWLVVGPGARSPAPGGEDLTVKAMPHSPVQNVQVNGPDAEAARLVQLLASLGVRADVQAVGYARLVRARVPAAALAPAGPALAQQGLVLPHDGQLAVLFEPRKP